MAGSIIYAYVQSNPLRWVDPTGLAKTGAAIGGVIGGVIGTVAGGIIGGGGGAVGGTLVAPGVGTVGAGAFGAAEGAAIGGTAGAGAGAAFGSAIEDIFCKDKDDTCEENLKRDLATCRALSKRGGKSAYAICERQAMLRYSNCLAGRDDGAPLPPWSTQ